MTGYGKVFMSALLLCSVSTPLAAQEVTRGQSLYENQCRTCHESWAHERKVRSIVTSMPELRRRVAAWATHSGLDWSSEEIEDVADYLNQTYYRFGPRE